MDDLGDRGQGRIVELRLRQQHLKGAAVAAVRELAFEHVEAQFARLGGMHRNTFINSPRLLDGQLRMKSRPHLRFAGQVTGVEGYVESAAIGLLAGRLAAAEQLGRVQEPPPATTAFGALLSHITGGADAKTFQPMNVNFGLFPDLEAGTNPRTGKPMKIKGGDRKQAMAKRALEALDTWLEIKPVTA